jgi:hypothetical protein
MPLVHSSPCQREWRTKASPRPVHQMAIGPVPKSRGRVASRCSDIWAARSQGNRPKAGWARNRNPQFLLVFAHESAVWARRLGISWRVISLEQSLEHMKCMTWPGCDGRYATYFDFPDFYEVEGRVFEPPRARQFFSYENKTTSQLVVGARVPVFLHTLCTRARDGPLFQRGSAEKIAPGSSLACAMDSLWAETSTRQKFARVFAHGFSRVKGVK